MASPSQALFSVIVTALLGTMADAGAASSAASPVAAASRQQRPAGAPIIKEFTHADAWRAKALHGVSEPTPASLKFLDSQGAWYTPFDRAGMPQPYDLRGWHDAKDFGAKKR